jgi:hypothetical protein
MNLHFIKNFYRRLRYGGGCCDVYGLDYYLAKKILPPLKEFRRRLAKGGGYPEEFNSMEEWLKTIDEMIWAFDFLLHGEEMTDDIEKDRKNWERQQKGFELFGKHYNSLWI